MIVVLGFSTWRSWPRSIITVFRFILLGLLVIVTGLAVFSMIIQQFSGSYLIVIFQVIGLFFEVLPHGLALMLIIFGIMPWLMIVLAELL